MLREGAAGEDNAVRSLPLMICGGGSVHALEKILGSLEGRGQVGPLP